MLKSQENLKAKNCLSPKHCYSQENQNMKNWKNDQKVGIYPNLTLKKQAKVFNLEY